MIQIRSISGFLFIFLAGLILAVLLAVSAGASALQPYHHEILLSSSLRLGTLCLGCLLPLLWPGAILKVSVFFSDRKNKNLILATAVIGIDLLARLTTPQIAFGKGLLGLGYGHDGAVYGWMTEHFAWFRHSVQAPFNGRILMPWIVHISALSTFSGYSLFNGLFYFANAWLVFQLMRFYKASEGVCSAAVILFCLIRFYEKFSVYYPVLTDMAGMFFLLAGINVALQGKPFLFALILTLGVLCRENILVLIPFFLICVCRTDSCKIARLKAAGFTLIPLLLFGLLRMYPVFQPSGSSSETDPLSFLAGYFQEPRRFLAFGLAHANTLGLIFFLPLFRFRQSLEFLRKHPEWLYYGTATVFLSLAGGMDYDRFAVWQAPLGLVLMASMAQSFSSVFWAMAVWIQFLITELWNPWFPDEMFYLSRYSWFPHSQTLEKIFLLPDSFEYQASAVLIFLFSIAAAFIPFWIATLSKNRSKTA